MTNVFIPSCRRPPCSSACLSTCCRHAAARQQIHLPRRLHLPHPQRWHQLRGQMHPRQLSRHRQLLWRQQHQLNLPRPLHKRWQRRALHRPCKLYLTTSTQPTATRQQRESPPVGADTDKSASGVAPSAASGAPPAVEVATRTPLVTPPRAGSFGVWRSLSLARRARVNRSPSTFANELTELTATLAFSRLDVIVKVRLQGSSPLRNKAHRS